MSDLNLVCLLPVRNGEADLPGYLEAVEGLADAVIALDDGSTDGTRQILDASPLVKLVLDNPPRADYVGWDDAANRNRLLEAAALFEPDWVLSLDADERIPPADAAVLRAFLETDALPGLAYGFKVYRMWQDLEHYDQAGLWVYRLFAFKPGQRFPDQRLHFVPIPTEIPRARWVRTTIRIQHLAGLTIDRRQARFDKYQQADPDNTFQHSYRDLLQPALDIGAWKTRRPGLPVLDVRQNDVAAMRDDAEHPELDEIIGRPALSAIIISHADGERLLRSVASVVNQECPWPFEVIVVTSGGGNGAALVRERFPDVTLVDLPQPALPGEARNAGLRLARGEYVSFPGSHVELPPGSLAARLQAHDLGYAMVTGTTMNGTRTWAGWASYFLDHSAVLPGRPSTELEGAPSHCSYRRNALLTVGGFPEDMRTGEDSVVNQALVRHGYQAYRAQDVTLIHHSPCRTPWKLVAHHFVRGRGLGCILRDRDRIAPKGLLGKRGVNFVRRQVTGRVKQTTQHVRQWSGDPTLEAEYRRAFPLVIAGATAAFAGALYEIVFNPTRRSTSQQRTNGVERFAGIRIPILTYHHLDIPNTKSSVSTAQLGDQLEWLKDQGFTPITMSRLLDAIAGTTGLPAQPVVITHDDGHQETPRFAEILDRHGVAATYFLPTRMPLSADQIRTLDLHGEVGGHTVAHPHLRHLSWESQRDEVADNKAFLESVVGHPIRCFAYPNGESTAETVRIVRETGFDGAVLAGRITPPNPIVDPYHLPRIPVLGTQTLEEFVSHVRDHSRCVILPNVTSVQSGLLPRHRVIAFYGHPRSAAMGILGQHDMETVLSKLQQQAAAYTAADPSRPVILALDLIATVAQPMPGTDGTYRLRTGAHLIDAYATFTAAHNLQLILDVQPGHADVAGEIEALRPWLVQPHVHLALDPEWMMGEGQVPGPRVGTIEEDVLLATQRALGKIVRECGLPPKMLIVHQFLTNMIESKRRLDSVPGVQLVVDINGAGAPRDKTKTYNALIRDNPGEFAGFKLFYTQDQPLMTASQVLALTPTPDLIIYQ